MRCVSAFFFIFLFFNAEVCNYFHCTLLEIAFILFSLAYCFTSFCILLFSFVRLFRCLIYFVLCLLRLLRLCCCCCVVTVVSYVVAFVSLLSLLPFALFL